MIHKISMVLGFGLILGTGNAMADEAGATAFFENAGARLNKDAEGHVIKIMHGGKPELPVADLQRLGELKHLESIALNQPGCGNDDWEFLHDLPNLKNLTIWHCKTISSLECFSDLPIESITVGGCMGLRDLNKDNPEKQRDAVLTLAKLPNLKSVNLYHSPTNSTDEILKHLATHFPKLEIAKLDFAAPRGFETSITPEGLKVFQKLPLKEISLENAHTFTAEHITVLAGFKTLEAVLIDVRRGGYDPVPLKKALLAAKPDLEVVVADESSERPPTRARKK